MDRPEPGLIKWSQIPGYDSFIHINLQHRVVQLYEPNGLAQRSKFDYERLSKHDDFPTLTTYDWSPTVPGLLAVGTQTGVVNLLRMDDNSNAYIELGLKMTRTCQAVAFNTEGLLAVGLDRVRMDQCLHIWDVNRLSSMDKSAKGFSKDMHSFTDPAYRLEPSVSVSSVKFFEDNPKTLVVGIKAQGLRIHDLREPNIGVVTFQTKCNNNLAIDYADQNYFASSALDQPGIMIWDRRATSRPVASHSYLGAVDEDELPWGGALRLDRVVDSDDDPSLSESKHSIVRSLRYCRDHRGLLAVLSRTGQLKVLKTNKELTPPDMSLEGSPELLEVYKSYDMDVQYGDSGKKNDRIVSFDWVTLDSAVLQPRLVVLRANGTFEILEQPSYTSDYLYKLTPWQPPHRGLEESGPYHNIMEFEPSQSSDMLGPLFVEEALSDIAIFGPDKVDVQTIVDKTLQARFSAADLNTQNLSTESQCLLDHVMLLRAKEKYLFDCNVNRAVVADDPWLRYMWDWIADAEDAAQDGGMKLSPLDLSYMGVCTIWCNDLGQKPSSRLPEASPMPETTLWEKTIGSICKRRKLPKYEGTQTKKPFHRQLCLDICGWGDNAAHEARGATHDPGEDYPTTAHTMAAARALFKGETQEAIRILKTASVTHPELLFVSLALQLIGRSNNKLSKEQLDFDEAVASKTDPYLRAISSLIATGDWFAIANQKSLPLSDRAYVAVRNFDDEQLTKWLHEQVSMAVDTGDVEGIVLTGITDRLVDIFAKYVQKFNDFQTATLVMSICAPRYIDDYRCLAWRNAYRAYLQRHKAFLQRTKFEVESTKKSKRGGRPTIKPPSRQIALRCVYCDAETTLAGQGGPGAGPPPGAPDSRNPLMATSINAGISCPNCGRHLPRCVVCLEVVGVPRSDRPELNGEPESWMAANFPTFCLKCEHVLHLDHARQWFTRHVECPVPECRCRCNFRANPELSYH
ncbi:putative WD repeat-containing protein [Colletotrichum sp. SAR 10_70]|nr:putative WD repeat-containing protein [Colletotrichum sp. SAR 10_71]KAI8184385.1 putative WD repeat-containing protein [Colletotrichum sp. SAR 10_70]KAI8190949.1 putative WD repeat-containing protein [Colletotrichum sp. SAR 10_65]KAI8208496.1 putative WD repeat-containing protein [Colletotrichum sp. SAR 10_76]KAI8220865.1 putative WD repeat-containing protein [Colletotrichum sp. SAR 10_96]KAI8258048.1 putative WD repeat-containing protein [Colletotrichum sp. SAR 10_77]KAJ4994865.1 putative